MTDKCERCGRESEMLVGVWVGRRIQFWCAWCTLEKWAVGMMSEVELRAKFPRRGINPDRIKEGMEL